ncbi:histo-blood group ABO system transferase 2-like isoform X2 [Lithobates pipiens]
MLPSRQYVIGAMVVMVLFVVSFFLYNPESVSQFKQKIVCLQKADDCSQKMDICSQKVDDKSTELAHCERKLLVHDLNGRYIRFLGPLLETAERFFMVGHNVTYYVFTDNVSNLVKPKMGEGRNLQLHEVSADKRWQDVSMRRMEILQAVTKEQMPNEIDYLVCADVDMVFNDHMGVEILGDLFATIHPGYFLADQQGFTYERRPISAAYIPYGEGDFYYMAALYGGRVEEIYKLSTACHNGIKEDKKKNIEAVWQEESHLNRYLVYNKPTKVLSPEYIWDTNLPNGELIKRKRFLAVHKNHEEVRN